MRKYILTAITCLTTLCAFPLAASNLEFELDYSVGYREDSLNWSIGTNHDIVSKLDWKDLQMVQYRADIRGLVCSQYYFRGYADYAHIYHGKNTDTDYAYKVDREGNIVDRNAVWLKSKQKASKGEAFDFSLGLGYQLDFLCGKLAFFPIAGYSYHEQHLRMFKGKVIVDTLDDLTGSFPGLHSSYKTRWQGPWTGFDTVYQWNRNLKLFGGFEYHWADYQATGHWNLRTDFVKDFEHSGHDGSGMISTLGISYDFCTCWTIGVFANYQTWNIRHGKDKTYLDPIVAEEFFDGNTSPVSRLHEVNWHSYSVNAFIGCYF